MPLLSGRLAAVVQVLIVALNAVQIAAISMSTTAHALIGVGLTVLAALIEAPQVAAKK